MKLRTYFIPRPNSLSPKVERQESLLVNFTIISFFFAIGYYVLSFFNGFLMARYVMIIAAVLFIAQLYAYKFRWISLPVITHFFVWICWLIVVVLSLASYGIHSYVLPWVSLIPIMALVLLSHREAWKWSAAGVVTVLVFALFEPEKKIPEMLLMRSNVLLITSLNIGLLFIVLTLTYIFDLQQMRLIQTIEHQNNEVQKSKEEISARNVALEQTQMEISSQRDTVAAQNEQLKAAHEIIDSQHHILIQKNEGLELEIQERTKELVEYNQQLEQFAFISSHDLRAPIARILGLGELLAITDSPDDLHRIQKELVQSARQLDHVVKDLNMILDIGKSTEKLISQLEVKSELESVLLNHKKEIADTNAHITMDVDQVHTLRTSKLYFNSIFNNLISNAIKYRRPEVPLHVHIEAKWKDEFALFTVRDNGMGIDLKTSGKKLFTLYSRFHESIEGKGLGLFMVRTQLKALGGKVEVESEVGGGTVFYVYIKPGHS